MKHSVIQHEHFQSGPLTLIIAESSLLLSKADIPDHRSYSTFCAVQSWSSLQKSTSSHVRPYKGYYTVHEKYWKEKTHEKILTNEETIHLLTTVTGLKDPEEKPFENNAENIFYFSPQCFLPFQNKILTFESHVSFNCIRR